MLLITELQDRIETITEATKDGKRILYLEGTVMQYDTPNRNGRIYPKAVMEKELDRYITEKVNTNRALGEMNHPTGASINLDRASHLFTNLRLESKGIVYGKARIADTPMGKIAEGLINTGVNLGISSRGLGSLKESPTQHNLMEVQGDFHLVTAGDLVADPSAPNAFVKGIMENVEWVFNEHTGEWMAMTQRRLHQMNKRQLEENALKVFKSYLSKLV